MNRTMDSVRRGALRISDDSSLTIRDHYAGIALKALIERKEGSDTIESLAVEAVEFADTILVVLTGR